MIRMKVINRLLVATGLVLFTCGMLNAQVHTDQNGLKTSVVKNLRANGNQAIRYTVAEVAMNSHHWQQSGFILVELFHIRYEAGYEKYKIQMGYGDGTGTSIPSVKLLESYGRSHNAKLEIGSTYPSGTSLGGYDNVIVPIHVDVKYYSNYSIKLTYVLNKVDELSGCDQIKIHETPIGVNIANFSAPLVDHSDENFAMKNGTVSEDLDVKGIINASEIQVTAQTADFVFEPDYNLRPLDEVEAFVKENKHLPEIPSAKQMEAEGVNVAEMNKLLLQKVEELTLYVIEQEKEISTLKANEKKIVNLEKAIEVLSRKLNSIN